MSVLDKFRKGAAKAGIQATAFLKEGSSRVQSSSQSFAQGFSLPGEAEKAAKILASFLGLSPTPPTRMHPETRTEISSKADPDHPESALNSIPKVVLQRARGIPTSAPSDPDPRLTPIISSSTT
jgi:SH3 domain-containing YSC84-like protein 1